MYCLQHKTKMEINKCLVKFPPLNVCQPHSWLNFSSVTQLCPTLCDSMDCSTPGFLVHHQRSELAQTHVHQVGDAIQSSHSLSSPSLAFNPSQHQSLFQGVSSSHQMAKVLEFQLQHQSFSEYSGLISFRIDWIITVTHRVLL